MKEKTELSNTSKGKGRPRGFDRKQALLQALDIFWRRGYEPTSIAELCTAMAIKPPSLYAAFGNKAQLFLEAVNYYESAYWGRAWEKFEREPDVRTAVCTLFEDAAEILSSHSAPCGCMVVLAAINVSPSSPEVSEAVKRMRQEGKDDFAARLRRAVADGQLPAATDVVSLATVLNTLLEGMSVEAKDGATLDALKLIGKYAVRLLDSAL